MSDPARLRSKATAIILANRAKAEGDRAEARAQFRQAARLEETVFRELADAGRADFLVNAMSAVSCWLEAGEAQMALGAAGRALSLAAGRDVDEELVGELAQLASQASEQDAERWYQERSPTSVPTLEEPLPLGVEHRHLLEDYRDELARVAPLLG